ncbi:MAG: hypothetical protein HOV87_33300 [Catenulispora sp.]|nr:hypothetical protein [Catenulispora sp.]
MATREELTEKTRGWFTGRLPEDLFEGAPEVTVDREEITVVGRIAEPAYADGASEAEKAAAIEGRIKEFRERTREARILVARDAEHKFGRKVSWGVRCGDEGRLFTHLSVPVMTRLRQPQRALLDTLVDGGVARSRSDALAWCVRLVEKNAGEWIGELREAMRRVEEVRETGPDRDGDATKADAETDSESE